MKKDKWRYKYLENPHWLEDKDAISPEDYYISIIDKESLEEKESLHDVINNLPTRYLDIIYSYFWEGKTLKEIGMDKRYSKQYAQQELKVGLKMLKDLLEDK